MGSSPARRTRFFTILELPITFSCAVLNLEQVAELLEQNRAAASGHVKEFAIGGKPFAFNSQPAIMGVLNLSADSWYRESVCLTTETAVQRGKILHAQGADIVDVGAESTLVSAARVDDAGQNSKLLPVVRALRAAGVLVSVETYQPAVTRACLAAGELADGQVSQQPSDHTADACGDNETSYDLADEYHHNRPPTPFTRNSIRRLS